MSQTKIEWTQRSWNPVMGCSKVSPGCKNCYAIRMAWRLQHNPKMADRYQGLTEKMEGGNVNWTGQVMLNRDALYLPMRVKKPTLWFVNSMSDLFHEGLSEAEIAEVFAVMAMTPQHTYQVLTKRPFRMNDMFLKGDFKTLVETRLHAAVMVPPPGKYYTITLDKQNRLPWPLPNVWLGTSVENQQAADDRIPYLLATPAAVRFLSCEPLLGPVDLTIIPKTTADAGTFLFNVLNASSGTEDLSLWGFTTIDWVIAGGESGPGARPMHPDWVRRLRDQCTAAGVPFFFKQWGEWSPGQGLVLNTKKVETRFVTYGRNDDFGMAHLYKLGKKDAGRVLDGRRWEEMPRK